MERIKWTDKIKNLVLLERVEERRIMLELIKKRKINWVGHWLRRNCVLEGCSRRHGKREEGSQILDDSQHYDKWTVCRYEKEGWEEGRLENYEFVVKDLPMGRTLLSTPVVQWLLYSPLDSRFAGSNPSGVDGFFQSVKIPSMISFGREVKPWVPCRRFTARKRTSILN